MKRGIALALLLCMLLCACGEKPEQTQGGAVYRIYYPLTLEQAQGGDAVGYRELRLEGSAAQVESRAQELLQQLLGGEEFSHPMLSGVTLRSISVGGGMAQVDLGGSYGSLSGINLTLADYCITLTLTQLPGIYHVHITYYGADLAYRDKNLFSPEDVVLSGTEDVVRTVEVKLFFLNEEGGLTEELRKLSLYEGRSQAEAIVEALSQGPQSGGLFRLLPGEFPVKASRVYDGVCYVSLPGGEETAVKQSGGALTLHSVVCSLCAVSGIEYVQFLVDGESRTAYAGINISKPMSPK